MQQPASRCDPPQFCADHAGSGTDNPLPDQKRVVEVMKAWCEKGSAYLQLQTTRPQLTGYLLADSPVAQAAWIYDIFNAGTGNTGDPEAVLSRDATNSAASSARVYLEQGDSLGKRNNPRRVDLPVARSWAPLVYPNLFY